MAVDPKVRLAQSAMTGRQIIAVGLCIFLFALDGFDVLAISFASPGIAADWQISRAELGVVLSMELIGMAVGSLIMGNLADRFGRRPIILVSLAVVTVGMFAAAGVHSVAALLVVRFITGLGIGGMLASINAMVSEYANDRHRSLCVMLNAGGYPVGVILGGSAVSVLLVYFDWRSIFVFGGCVSAVSLILVWFLLPESLDYLLLKRPADCLQKINRTLKKIGHDLISELPPLQTQPQTAPFKQLFSGSLLAVTLLLTFAYFCHIMTFYYIIKWIPKLVVDMQYAPSTAGGVLVWANVGGALGSVVLGVLAVRFQLKRLIMAVMVASFVMVAIFGLGADDLWQLSLISALVGFFTNAGVVGMYALFAQSFPASIRASGTGFAIGIGRGGAACGPVLAGLLFDSGLGLLQVSIIMALGALVAAITLMFLRTQAPSTATNQA